MHDARAPGTGPPTAHGGPGASGTLRDVPGRAPEGARNRQADQEGAQTPNYRFKTPTVAPRRPPGVPETAQEAPKSSPKKAPRRKNGPVPFGKRAFFKDSPLELPGDPRRPERPPRSPQGCPRGLQDSPNGPLASPRRPQDCPRGPQDGAKKGLRGAPQLTFPASLAQESPRRLQNSSPRPPQGPKRPPKRLPRGPKEAPKGFPESVSRDGDGDGDDKRDDDEFAEEDAHEEV